MNPSLPAEFVSPDLTAFRTKVRDEALAEAANGIRRAVRDRARDIEESLMPGVSAALAVIEQLRAGVAR